MKKHNEKIDDLIKETLNAEEAKFYDELEEQDLFGMVGGVFKGKMKWFAIVMNIVNLLVFGLLIYCIAEFINMEETADLIKMAVAIGACIMMMSMIKLYMWMQLDKNAILRELKRVELQVAALSSK